MKLFKKNNPAPFARGREKLKRDFFHQPLNLPKVNLYSTQKWALIIFLSVILGLIIFSRMPSRTYQYTLGQVVPQDIKAPQDFLVEDQPSTLEKRKSATESVRGVYDFDPNLLSELEGKTEDVFSSLKELDLNAERKITKEEFAQLMGISISSSSFAVLKKRKFDSKLVDYVYTILSPIFEQKIVGSRELLLSEKDRGIVVRDFSTREETNLQDFSQILDLDQARFKVQKEARLLIPPSAKSLEKPIVEIVQGLIKPNLTFNKIETEERKEAARGAVKPVLFEIKKGEMIIREGEKVNPEHLLKLNQLSQLKTDRNPILYSGGNFLILFLILSVTFRFFVPEKSPNPRQWGHDLSFISAMLILITIMIRIGASLPQPELLFLSENSLWFAVPVAAGAIVISVVKGMKQAAIFSVLISIFSTMVLGNKIDYFFYPLLGSLIGAREAAFCRQRSTLLKAGFEVGVANFLVILCLKIKLGGFFDWQPLTGDLILGFSSGILAGIVATGVIPLIEVMFSYTTDIKLLELGNLNHPLLKELIMQAPGTYHHSILTGSLVEAAAESIGANPLLAKVGAYYHDIGKMKKPLYFIENQRGSENKHDKLSPNMSSLILISHIKEGVEQAKEHRLGNVITDIIQQHHGTSLIAFFYQKAKEKENPTEATVDENDFRYPGPKPQTKEAGLVMLADSVEASSRTLNDSTPARIQGMVQKTINNFFTDGQLNECELTLKDLHLIAKSFNRILTGIFHHRIEYPDKIFPAPMYSKKHETLDRESPKETKDKLKNGQEDRERDLKRLGIS
jgi:putative nucleotidyltransferase with HDIG domain